MPGNRDYRAQKILAIFSGINIRCLLDVGCGDGDFSVAIKKASKAVDVYGIEISEEGVNKANTIGVKAFQVDINQQDFPFDNQAFDGVFCGEIIEHLYDPDHLLDEVYRVLKPGGICVFTTPNLSSWLNRIVLLLGFQPFATRVSLRHNVGKLKQETGVDQYQHIRVFTFRALKELLIIHNFSLLKSFGTYNATDYPLFITIIANIFSIFPSLSTNVIMIVKKE